MPTECRHLYHYTKTSKDLILASRLVTYDNKRKLESSILFVDEDDRVIFDIVYCAESKTDFSYAQKLRNDKLNELLDWLYDYEHPNN